MVLSLSRLRFCSGLLLLLGFWLCYRHVMLSDSTKLRVSGEASNGRVHWHIDPIHPHHEGKVVFLTSFSKDWDYSGSVINRRTYTTPCACGLLVFNVGPAAKGETYTYEFYEEFYFYSNNGGLCILYPSYEFYTISTNPLWTAHDLTEQSIKLGDVPNKISSLVDVEEGTKHYNHSDPNYRGGVYVVMRHGDFYDESYAQRLKDDIHSWPKHVHEDDIPKLLSSLWSAAL